MRHLVSTVKLGKTTAHRRAMLRNLVTSLILEERIETTLPKAKELRRWADRMVTLGKAGTLHARRRALAYVRDPGAVHKLFADYAVRFAGRNGGYTRIIKLGARYGDAAPMAIIEYLGAPVKPSRAERKQAKAEAAKPTPAKAKAKKAKPKEKPEKKEAKPAKKAEKAAEKRAGPKTAAVKVKAKERPAAEAPEKKGEKVKRRGLGAVFRRKGQREKGK